MRIAIRTGFGDARALRGDASQARGAGADYFRDLITARRGGKEIRDLRPARLAARPLPGARARRAAARCGARAAGSIYGSYVALVAALARALRGRDDRRGARSRARLADDRRARLRAARRSRSIGDLGTFIDQSDYQTECGLRAFVGLERLERARRGRGETTGPRRDAAGLPREEIRFERRVVRLRRRSGRCCAAST